MTDKPTSHQIEREAALQWVPLKLMTINELAQRAMNFAWVNKLALKFDLEDMGNPTVNHVSGSYHVIDGQHRVEALKIWLGDGWEGQEVQCWTYEGLSDADEAEKFLKLQQRLHVQSLDRFRIAVSAGRETESEIQQIVEALGLTISRYKGGIMATGTLKRVYERGGPEVLARTLRVIRDAYGEPGLEASVIDGIGLFAQRYNGTADDNRLVERLASARGGVGGLLNKGTVLRKQTGNARGQCVADDAVEIYNRGMGGRKLPSWWKTRNSHRGRE